MKSSKGSDFERSLSKQLSLWWTNGERDDIFWRSQQSGGRATQRRKNGKTTANQEGDLTAMDPIGQPLIDQVCIEAKCGYPDFNIEGEINKSAQKTILRGFLEQCEKEINDTKRHWWLIVKQNRKKPIILFSISFLTFLRSKNVTEIRKQEYLEIRFASWHIMCLRLDDFLSIVKPQVFR